jgi:antitoxin (DNA-binding transcriptional repressor) of toxin-antitoxin stability system
MAEVEQRLYSRRVSDIGAAVESACKTSGLMRRMRPGDRVGITVGSRGIANLAAIVRTVVAVIRGAGGKPFILPAMGSHGGGTPEGQTAVLASLGVTSRSVGAPLRASMRTRQIGRTGNGVPVFAALEALRADGLVVLNRIKQHSDYTGDHESGLVKMLAIGVGKRDGAMALHSRRAAGLREDVPQAAARLLQRLPVIAGLAIVENGYDETAQIVGLKPGDIMAREKALLRRVRRNAAGLPFPEIDLLIMDWIGKDISGIGMDSRVVARRMLWEEPEFRGVRIQLIAALGLTEASHGNALGVGLADLITERLLAAADMQAIKTNVLHTGWLNRAKLPLAFPNDREVLRAALIALGRPGPRQVRVVRIRDTLHLGRLLVSEALLPAARRNPRLRLLSRPKEMAFDRAGNLKPFPG